MSTTEHSRLRTTPSPPRAVCWRWVGWPGWHGGGRALLLGCSFSPSPCPPVCPPSASPLHAPSPPARLLGCAHGCARAADITLPPPPLSLVLLLPHRRGQRGLLALTVLVTGRRLRRWLHRAHQAREQARVCPVGSAAALPRSGALRSDRVQAAQRTTACSSMPPLHSCTARCSAAASPPAPPAPHRAVIV